MNIWLLICVYFINSSVFVKNGRLLGVYTGLTNCAECCKIIIEPNCVYSVGGGTPTTYYFQRNLLGDVVAIYDTTGTKVVEYAYDAYGNCTIKQGAGNTISKINPIRYRGYYYDRETNLYYLNSRYYNPEWRRFISPANVSAFNPRLLMGLICMLMLTISQLSTLVIKRSLVIPPQLPQQTHLHY